MWIFSSSFNFENKAPESRDTVPVLTSGKEEKYYQS